MNISFSSLFYLFGAAQALLLIVGINLNKPLLSDLKKVTTLLLLTMMITMVYYVVILNKYYTIAPYIDSLGTAAWMAIAPLFYLLTLSIQVPRWKLKWQHMRYLIIPLIFVAEGILTTLGLECWLYLLVMDVDLYLDLWMFTFFSTGFYFVLRSMRLTRLQASAEGVKNKELTWFIYAFFVVLLCFAIAYIWIRENYTEYFELVMICLFEVFVFTLVYKVFKMIPFRSFFELSKYENQSLSKDRLRAFALQLEQVMTDEKPYLDKKLSLNDLAKISGVNANDLSQLFALYYQSNFYEFINRYRLENLEKMILDPSYDQYKIMALAEESGFNSKATFYKVFKEKHQLTPVQFVKRYKQQWPKTGA